MLLKKWVAVQQKLLKEYVMKGKQKPGGEDNIWGDYFGKKYLLLNFNKFALVVQ